MVKSQQNIWKCFQKLKKISGKQIKKKNLKILSANHKSLKCLKTRFKQVTKLHLFWYDKDVTVGQTGELKRNHHKQKPVALSNIIPLLFSFYG